MAEKYARSLVYHVSYEMQLVSLVKVITLGVSTFFKGHGDGGLLHPWHVGETAGC